MYNLPANCHVSFDRDAEGQISGGRLGDEADRINERGEIRKYLPVIERQISPRVRVNRR